MPQMVESLGEHREGGLTRQEDETFSQAGVTGEGQIGDRGGDPGTQGGRDLRKGGPQRLVLGLVHDAREDRLGREVFHVMEEDERRPARMEVRRVSVGEPRPGRHRQL